MDLQFSNIAFATDNEGNTHSLIIACRDREAQNERWVLGFMSGDEVKKLYEFLGDYLKEEP